MRRPERLLGGLCGLAVLVAGCRPEASAPPFEASADRVVRKEFVFAGRKFVQTTRHKDFPLDPRVQRATFGTNSSPPDEAVSVVAIADPRTPGERLWNEFISRHADSLVREMYGTKDQPAPLFPQNVWITISLTSVGPDLLQASWEASSYGYDQAHGSTSTGSLLWSLTKDRQITAEDIFRPESHWAEALALPLTRILVWPEPVDEPSQGYTALQRSQTPVIAPDGLWLRFKENENERWWQGQSACLRWSVLKPYLRKSLPFDLSKLRWTGREGPACTWRRSAGLTFPGGRMAGAGRQGRA
jgi:hypothetical protein